MSKEKKQNAKFNNIKRDENYYIVLEALNYLFKKQDAEERRAIARIKIKKLIGLTTLIGAVVLIALSIISTYSFDFSWMTNGSKWYSDIYISFTAYIIITDIVMILEKYCNVDQKPVFGYIWPFVGFIITLILTNSLNVTFIDGEPRLKVALFFVLLLPASLMMVSSYRTGKEIARQKESELNKVKEIIETNPKVVETIMNDYNDFIKEKTGKEEKK